MKEQDIKTKGSASTNEKFLREKFFKLFRNCPIPNNELLLNLGLFIKRQDLTRILFMNELYNKIINVNGIVVEFGVKWGVNLALFESFRGIYEPFNHSRKLVGFDTFEGFPSVHEKDGKSEIVTVNAYSTTKGYEEYLKQILDYLIKMLDTKYEIKETENPSFISGRAGKILIKNKEVGIIGEIKPIILKNNKIKMPVASLEIDIENF